MYSDADWKVFCLEMRCSGNATYYLRYRDEGGIKSFKIELANEIDLAAARKTTY